MAHTFRHVFLPLNTLCMRDGFGMWHNDTTTTEGVYDLMGTINHFREGVKGRADFLKTDVKLLLQVHFLFLIMSVFILKDQAPHVATMTSEFSNGREVLFLLLCKHILRFPRKHTGYKMALETQDYSEGDKTGPGFPWHLSQGQKSTKVNSKHLLKIHKVGISTISPWTFCS